MNYRLFTALAFIVFLGQACNKTIPGGPEENEVLDGPLEGLSHSENIQFLKGDLAFTEVFTTEKGLGPLFVANSCISCHAGDGKGHPFTTLTRFGQPDELGNLYLQLGGPQLQNRAIPGFAPEVIPAGATSTNLTPPMNTGLGFLDAVSDEDLLALADPDDLDGDGISGVPNWITPPDYAQLRESAVEENGKYIHRFGKKAAAYDLLHQSVNAYNQDMGITSSYDRNDTYTGLNIEPEVTDNTLNDLVFYLKTLKAPLRRSPDAANVLRGELIFTEAQCASCHTPTLLTAYSPIEALSEKVFHPYTDLLLHDMGPGLDDGYTEGNASTAEWKTPALWGLGLAPMSQGGEYFLLHDGRAHSIEEAIIAHGGEAENSRLMYEALSTSDKEAILEFLESL
jgi:CxxC motif-containing protein (DUF1111 family)